MKEENRRYAEEAFEIVEHAAKKIGSEVLVLSLYVRNLPYLRERR